VSARRSAGGRPRRAAALLLLLLLAGCSVGEERRSGAAHAEATVLSAQAARFRAMIAGDATALARLLAEELTYTHTTGRVENRQEFLAAIRSGALRYHAIDPHDVVVTLVNDAAVVVGRVTIHAELDGREARVTARFTEVHQLRRGEWRLLAWQSTTTGD
jgi:hypothetical protein